ncbi:hypothetical protein HID58_079435 [Brassica napus]|uniref:GH3 middle domain-containing protein n=1 Tax=Brassica napus TaxID=3708 RepID=A0ABQ7Y201_BRANA|nr:hypothetical protein HID58_079435 [Brassica napus]
MKLSISFRFVSMSMMLSKERGWHFIILLRIYNTPSGLPATSSLTCFLTSDIFKNWPSNFNSSPKEVTLCPIDKQNVYCHLLCDLVRRDEVVCMISSFAFSMAQYIPILDFYSNKLSLVSLSYGSSETIYKMGDILQVTGFYNSAPEFKFAQRKKYGYKHPTGSNN